VITVKIHRLSVDTHVADDDLAVRVLVAVAPVRYVEIRSAQPTERVVPSTGT
jgi:hypothetical protein